MRLRWEILLSEIFLSNNYLHRMRVMRDTSHTLTLLTILSLQLPTSKSSSCVDLPIQQGSNILTCPTYISQNRGSCLTLFCTGCEYEGVCDWSCGYCEDGEEEGIYVVRDLMAEDMKERTIEEVRRKHLCFGGTHFKVN